MDKAYLRDFMFAFFSPTQALLGVYFFGLLAISLLGNLLYGWLTAPNSIQPPGAFWVIGIVVGLFALAFLLWRQHRTKKFMWRGGNEIAKHEGLITMLSTVDIIKSLIKHHAPKLKHVWILTDREQKGLTYFETKELPTMLNDLEKEGVNTKAFQIIPIPFDAAQSGAERSYEIVRHTFLNKPNLPTTSIVADITSATKEMTAGMVLACVAGGWKMSYVRSDYEWDSTLNKYMRKPGTEKVIEFDVGFLRPSTTDDTTMSPASTN